MSRSLQRYRSFCVFTLVSAKKNKKIYRSSLVASQRQIYQVVLVDFGFFRTNLCCEVFDQIFFKKVHRFFLKKSIRVHRWPLRSKSTRRRWFWLILDFQINLCCEFFDQKKVSRVILFYFYTMVLEFTGGSSEANLVGGGGRFGWVYCGVLTTGGDAAVKRLEGGEPTGRGA